MKFIKISLALSILLLSSLSYANKSGYEIFVDAGSSGSRLHIFKYEYVNALPTIDDVFSESVNPGLSSYADHPESAGPSLAKLFDDATQYLHDNQVDTKTVPVNVFATAGMRLLPENKQTAIYTNVRDYLVKNFSFSMHDVKTISGKMEGVYGWLDVNYLLNNFQNGQMPVGIIDMGGASTEIAFTTQDNSKPDDEIQININQKNYLLFSKSFLGMGQDEARKTMLTEENANSCFPQNYVMSDNNLGNFNMRICGSIYHNFLQNQQIQKQLLPLSKINFIAYSGIYYTYHFLNTEKTTDQATVEDRIQNVCNETWAELQTNYPNIPAKYLSTYCANSVYHSKLLYEQYRITGDKLIVANQINDREIDWTLGAELYDLISNSNKV